MTQISESVPKKPLNTLILGNILDIKFKRLDADVIRF